MVGETHSRTPRHEDMLNVFEETATKAVAALKERRKWQETESE